jgi:hypothetical protein
MGHKFYASIKLLGSSQQMKIFLHEQIIGKLALKTDKPNV